MSALIDAVLLLTLAAGPDDSAALADLGRRLAPVADRSDRRSRRQQEDPRPQRPEEPLQNPESAPPTPWVDFEWLELHTRAGMAIFSKDFHIDPSPCFQVEGRAPLPWLSPSDNPDGDYFAVFAELGVAIVKRTITPAVAKPGGPMMMLTVGVDYSVIRNATWMVLVRAGIQYASYGGITDLQDGMAPMVGVTAGITVSRSVSITLSPEYILGDGDNVMFGTVGVAIDF